MNFCLQILADIVEKRREISHARQVVVDSVGGRQEPCGRCREYAKLRNHRGRIGSSAQDFGQHVPDKSRDENRFNQKPRRRVEYVVLLHGADIPVAALCVFVNEVVLLAADLDFLDRVHGFGDPLEQSAVKVLILFAGADHNRLDHPLDDH